MPFLVFEENSDNLRPLDKSEFFRSASEIFRSWSFCCSSSRKLFSKDSNSSVSGETRLELQLEPRLRLLNCGVSESPPPPPPPPPPPTPVLKGGAEGTMSVMMWSSDILLSLSLLFSRVSWWAGNDRLEIISNLKRDFLIIEIVSWLTFRISYQIMTWLMAG